MKLQPFTSVGLSLIVSVMAVPACAVDQTVPAQETLPRRR
jgi:hypothetical protein